jgi:hypothetical protein
LWWLTFIINTGWFYVDLDNNLDTIDVNLYKKLNIIVNIFYQNMGQLFDNFLLDISKWNAQWSDIMITLQRDNKIPPSFFLNILDSHICNLFNFRNYGKEMTDDNNITTFWSCEDFINDKTVDSFNRSCIYFFKKSIYITQEKQGQGRARGATQGSFTSKGQGRRIDAYIEGKSNRNYSRVFQKPNINNNRFNKNLQKKEEHVGSDRFSKNTTRPGFFGGDYTKKKKAIKRNNKKYSIRKKHKKTKKRHIKKRKNTKRL